MKWFLSCLQKIINMKYWLLKSEPDVWSIEQQKRAGKKGAPWDGVQFLNKDN